VRSSKKTKEGRGRKRNKKEELRTQINGTF
jgi:hypothetical protein